MYALLLSLFLQHPKCMIRPPQARVIVRSAITAARSYHVPAYVVLAAVLKETGGRRVTVTLKDGSCDIGPWQIHTTDCRPAVRIALNVPQASAMSGAALLDWSRKRCMGSDPPKACERSVWALYNAGSKTWSKDMEEIIAWFEERGAQE